MSASSRSPVSLMFVVLGVLVVALSGCADTPTHSGSASADGRSPAVGNASASSTSPATPDALSTTVAVTSAVFAAPGGSFLCSLRHGVADCMWPRDTQGIVIPAAVCSPEANEGPELHAVRAPGWLCGTDVGVLASAQTVDWAPPGTATAPVASGIASPELADGPSLTSEGTECRGVGQGVKCTTSGGWFYLAPGHFAAGTGR